MSSIPVIDSLSRHHYYVLKTQKLSNAKPLKYNNKLIYLHRHRRGWREDSFSHNDMTSFLRVLLFKFFGYACLNIDDLFDKFDNFNIYYYYDENGNRVHEPLSATSESIKEMIVSVFGKPYYVKISEYNWCKYEILDFCNFIDNLFNSPLSSVLIEPILTVYTETYDLYYMCKATKNRDSFMYIIAPSLYDYIMTRKIFAYIESL